MEHLPFGAFNPRFYGVSIFLGGDDRRAAWARYEGEDGPAIAATRGLSDADAFVLSAVDHETRHYHDFLLSPLGTVTMGLRTQASVNGLQALQSLHRCPGRFVPTPLIRWIELDEGARRRWVAENGAFLGGATLGDFVALPHEPAVLRAKLEVGEHRVPDSLLPEQQLARYAVASAQAYASMSMLRQRRVTRHGLEVAADDIFEATAHLVQAQAIWTGQSAESAAAFLEFALSSEAGHLQPLQLLWELLRRGSETSMIRRAVELFTWMLLGPWDQLDSIGHPAYRFFAVCELAAAAAHDEVFADLPTTERFDRLDRLSESPGWRSNLQSAAESADRRQTAWSSASRTLRGGYFNDVFGVNAAWHGDQSFTKRAFAADPDSYLDLVRYLRGRNFPFPFVETRFGHALHERGQQVNSPDQRVIAVEDEGRRVLSYISKLESSQSSQTLDHVTNARILTYLIDFAFTDEPAGDLLEDWCKLQLKPIAGKEFLSVY